MLNTQNTKQGKKGVTLAKTANAPVTVAAPATPAPTLAPASAFAMANGQPVTKAALVAWCNAHVGGYNMASLAKVQVNVLPTANIAGNATLYKGNKLPFGYGNVNGARALYQNALLGAPNLAAFMQAIAGKQKGYNEFSTPYTVLALLNGGYGPLCRAGYWGTPFITLTAMQ